MKTIKLSESDASMVACAVSAYIREWEKEQYDANCKGYNPPIYDKTIIRLKKLKQNIDNQIQ